MLSELFKLFNVMRYWERYVDSARDAWAHYQQGDLVNFLITSAGAYARAYISKARRPLWPCRSSSGATAVLCPARPSTCSTPQLTLSCDWRCETTGAAHACPPHGTLSQMLGIAILAGACITKLPQIAAVVNARSADGLSLVSIELENFVYLVHASYGYLLVRNSWGSCDVTCWRARFGGDGC